MKKGENVLEGYLAYHYKMEYLNLTLYHIFNFYMVLVSARGGLDLKWSDHGLVSVSQGQGLGLVLSQMVSPRLHH